MNNIKNFDNKSCDRQSAQTLYTQVCTSQKAPDIGKCVNGLTQYCKFNIYSDNDFKTQNNLLRCYIQQNCKGDEQCMKKCESQ